MCQLQKYFKYNRFSVSRLLQNAEVFFHSDLSSKCVLILTEIKLFLLCLSLNVFFRYTDLFYPFNAKRMKRSKDTGRPWILMWSNQSLEWLKSAWVSSYCFNLTGCKNNHDQNHDFKVLKDDIPSVVISMGLMIMSIGSFTL